MQNTFKGWPNTHFLNFKKDNFEEYYPGRFQERVRSVLSLRHGPKKQNAKKELLIEVMSWSLSNRVEAIKEFKQSAVDVIRVLKSIESKLAKR